MYSHLVTVEVSVESCTYERVELDGTALNEDRLESLDTESVKRRSTVQEDGVILDDIFEDIPYLRVCSVNELPCCLDIELLVEFNELLDYEGLKSSRAISLGRPH